MSATARQNNEFVDSSVVRVPTEKVFPFEGNARIVENSSAGLLEASIRDRGLTGFMPVTTRPGTDHYVCVEGWNTRLTLVKKALAETGDERFAEIAVEVRPYKGELEIYLGHFIENNVRGNLSYGEAALEMDQIYRQFVTENADADWATFASFARNRGLPADRGNFSRQQFYAQKIAPSTPFLRTRSRVTKSDVLEVRRIHTAFLKAWNELGFGDAAEFEEVFAARLAKQDADLAKTVADVDGNAPTDLKLSTNRLIADLKKDFLVSDGVEVSPVELDVILADVLKLNPVASATQPKAAPEPSSQASQAPLFEQDESVTTRPNASLVTPSSEPSSASSSDHQNRSSAHDQSAMGQTDRSSEARASVQSVPVSSPVVQTRPDVVGLRGRAAELATQLFARLLHI